MRTVFKKQFVKYAIGLILLTFATTSVLSQSLSGNIISYNYETAAKNVPIYYPTSIDQVQNIIKTASQNNVKVRFSGASHSTSSIILGSGIYIKSEKFNRIDGIVNDPQHGPVVQVESGVKLGDLSDYLSERGYSLGFAYPYYYGLTIGGVVSTGAHGSSKKHTAQSSQNIVEMMIVNGRGELITINNQTPSWLKAARVSLGLLGFIYKMKLKIVPEFNIEFKSTPLIGDTALLKNKGVVNWGPIADTEYIYWFPADDRAIKVEGHITTKNEFPAAESVVLGATVNSFRDRLYYETISLGKNNSKINKWLEDLRFKNLLQNPPSYTYQDHGKTVSAQGIIGRSSKMLLSKRISQSPVYTGQDISFSFRADDAATVMQMIHEFCAKNNFRFPFAGIYLRFANSDGDSYISHIERADSRGHHLYVMAEFFELKEYTLEDEPSLISKLRNEMLAPLVEKNLITFHWAKNRNEIFASQANKKSIGNNILEFEKVRTLMDPYNVFSNSFTDTYLLNK